jgi:hypothetical protein
MGILFLIYYLRDNTDMLRDDVCMCLEVVTRRINICVIEAARDGLCRVLIIHAFSINTQRKHSQRGIPACASMAAQHIYLQLADLAVERKNIIIIIMYYRCVGCCTAGPQSARWPGNPRSLSALTECEGGTFSF